MRNWLESACRHCRSLGGKVVTDVLLGDSPQKCVRQSMQHDIGIGMTAQLFVEGNRDTAKQDTFAGNETVHIETATDSYITGMSRRRLHVLGVGDFNVVGVALYRHDFYSVVFGNGCVVAGIVRGCFCHVPMGFEDSRKVEALRRLCPFDVGALDGFCDHAVFDSFDGIKHVEDWQDGLCVLSLEGGKNRVDKSH